MMSRCLRHVPEGGAMMEITTRTIQGRFLLRPSKDLNEIVLGIVGRAQRYHKVELFGISVLSNHYHMLAWAKDSDQIANFMEFVNSNLSAEVGRLVDWPETMFPERYRGIIVSDERRAQEGRLRYLLKQGVKENLVETPEEWPGVNSVKVLCYGAELFGYWYDRTQEGAARRRGEKFEKRKYAKKEKVTLSPLPCWKGESEEKVRARVRRMTREIIEEAAADRRAKKTRVLGVKAIKSCEPHTRPKELKSSPAPDFHAVDPDVRRDLRKEYRDFAEEYSRRSVALREVPHNEWDFPDDCFPPPLPYVPFELITEPAEPAVRSRDHPPEKPPSTPSGKSLCRALIIPNDAHPG